MAYINISLDEAVKVVKYNVNLPSQITDIRVNGEDIAFSFDLGMMFSNKVLNIAFSSFSNGSIHFKIALDVPLKPILPLIKNLIPSNSLYTFDGDMLVFRLNDFLKHRNMKLNISNMEFYNKNFYITADFLDKW